MLREFLIHPYNDEIPCCSSIQLWQSNMLRITKSTWDFSFFLFSDLSTLRSFFTFRQLFSAFDSFAFRYHCFQFGCRFSGPSVSSLLLCYPSLFHFPECFLKCSHVFTSHWQKLTWKAYTTSCACSLFSSEFLHW